MKITELIATLTEITDKCGDLDVFAFHHEGGNSLRGIVDCVDRESLLIDTKSKTLTIGAFYK